MVEIGVEWSWRRVEKLWRGESKISEPSNQLDHHPPSDHRGCPLQAGKGNVAFRIQEPVNLGAAGLEQRGHFIFGYFLFLHGLFELPGDDLLDRLCLGLFKDAFFLQKIVNSGPLMLLAFFTHCCKSFSILDSTAVP